MIRYTVDDIVKASGGRGSERITALSDTVLTAVSTDTRSIESGAAYFAIKGENFDGASFVRDALGKGAALAVVNADSADEYSDLPVVAVEDTVKALGDVARDYRSRFEGRVIGITGSSGKTTSKEMITAVTSRVMNVHATRGNLNNHIGLPLTVFGLEESHDCAVIEMGMSAAGEIRWLGGIAQPHVGVLLNVGPAHLEFFDSIEGIADAKMELLETIDPNGIAIINGDDALLKPAFERYQGTTLSFGFGENCEVRAESYVIDDNGCVSFRVREHAIHLSVPGKHMVYNALAAFATGSMLGIDSAVMADALSSFTAPNMRMEIVEKKGVRFLNDSYNANPMSMKSALEVLRSIGLENGGRRIAVIGTMLELGDTSEEAHREIGEAYGGAELGMLCCVGEMAETYRNGAVAAGMDSNTVHCFGDSGEAARFIEEEKGTGDVILVKGSRGVRMETILEEKA